jgi:hypothetical protein
MAEAVTTQALDVNLDTDYTLRILSSPDVNSGM